MTNIKRVLSLALAAVMLMGMMVIGAGAANIEYSDAESIENAEAVTVLTALDVLGGYPDGSFKPEGTLTRAEAAAVICRIMLGADVAESLSTATAPFADVKATNWAAGYLAYLKNLGVISGIGNNKYNPQGTVTVGEFAKMLLGAAGIEGQFTGSQWLINVTVAAQQAGILSSSDKVTDAATRDAVAGYTLSALFVGEEVSTTSTKYVTHNSDTDTNTIHDTYAEAAAAIEAGETYEGSIVVTETTTKDSLADTVFKLKTVTAGTKDDFGRPATSYVRNNKEIAKFAKDAALTYTTSVELGDVYKALGLSETATVTTANHYQNGVGGKGEVSIAKNSETPIGGNGIVTEFYKSGDNYIVVQIVPTFAQVEVTTKAATKTEGAYTKYDFGAGIDGKVYSSVVDADNDKDTAVVTGTVADDDYVLYYEVDDTLYIQAVSTITGVVTSKTSAGVLTISGSTYQESDATNAVDVSVNKDEKTFYVDSYGYILGTKAADEAGANYAMVIDTNKYSVLEDGKIVTKYEAIAVQADGTVATFVLANEDAYTTLTGVEGANLGKVYTYTTNSKGVTTFVTAANAKAQTSIATNNAALTGNLYANSTTKFYVVNWTKDADDNDVVAGTVTVYTGIANVPDYDGLTKTYAVDTDKTADSIANVVFIYDNVKATVADEYIYLKGTYTETVDGKAWDAIIKGEETTILIPTGSEQDGGAALAKGLYTSIEVTEENYTATAAGAATVKKVQNNGGLLFTSATADGTLAYASMSIKNDVPVYCIDTTDLTVTVKTGADLDGKAMTGDIYVVAEDDAVVSIYVLNA